MHLATLVELVESGLGERVLLGSGGDAVTGVRLGELTRAGASTMHRHGAVVYVGENHPLLPVALLASAWAGVPFVPLNYRLDDRQLVQLVSHHAGALVLTDAASAARLTVHAPVQLERWLDTLPQDSGSIASAIDDDGVAVTLYTSGTTSDPKSVLLRHRHLMAYLLGTLEFASANDDEAALVAVPPYHVAGIANMLSNLFVGRRLVYLRTFEPRTWLDTVREEGVTHAMVVPTMLARIVDAFDDTSDVASLRTLSYGGAKLPERVLLQALRRFPTTGFVNAYGLTETASTIAVLGPDDHRAALESNGDARRRLSSVGRVLPTVEVEIRDNVDAPVRSGDVGIVHVRGDQISGEYGTGSALDADGWFCTQDRGYVDDDGYLFIEGRADDTIIRGGENVAPAEIEEVLLDHPDVTDACVVGLPDDEWGQRIAAVVVVRAGSDVSEVELRDRVRRSLRGSKTPDTIVFRDSLPHTDTGKLLRRLVVDDLGGSS
jgi:acyl-CoA synthetase (AMP-forming)/AMP-acid ligase II